MSSPRRVLVGRSGGRRRPPEYPGGETRVDVPAEPKPRAGSGTPAADPSLPGSRRRSTAETRAERIAAARGYADGLARGQAEVAAAVAAAGALAAELERLAPRDAARAAVAISRLALVVAERILGRAVVVDPALLVEVIERAAAAINGSPTARVILHPTARPIVEAAWIARYGTAHLGKRWLFEADPSLSPGGCRLVYEHGFVDASLETQIEELRRAVDHALPALLREIGALGRDEAGDEPAGDEAPSPVASGGGQ
jgi:flagellar assembly protein FliH